MKELRHVENAFQKKMKMVVLVFLSDLFAFVKMKKIQK